MPDKDPDQPEIEVKKDSPDIQIKEDKAGDTSSFDKSDAKLDIKEGEDKSKSIKTEDGKEIKITANLKKDKTPKAPKKKGAGQAANKIQKQPQEEDIDMEIPSLSHKKPLPAQKRPTESDIEDKTAVGDIEKLKSSLPLKKSAEKEDQSLVDPDTIQKPLEDRPIGTRTRRGLTSEDLQQMSGEQEGRLNLEKYRLENHPRLSRGELPSEIKREVAEGKSSAVRSARAIEDKAEMIKEVKTVMAGSLKQIVIFNPIFWILLVTFLIMVFATFTIIIYSCQAREMAKTSRILSKFMLDFRGEVVAEHADILEGIADTFGLSEEACSKMLPGDKDDSGIGQDDYDDSPSNPLKQPGNMKSDQANKEALEYLGDGFAIKTEDGKYRASLGGVKQSTLDVIKDWRSECESTGKCSGNSTVITSGTDYHAEASCHGQGYCLDIRTTDSTNDSKYFDYLVGVGQMTRKGATSYTVGGKEYGPFDIYEGTINGKKVKIIDERNNSGGPHLHFDFRGS